MIAKRFVDTNVFVYAAMGKGAQEAKRLRANELILEGEFGISGQVLAEFFTNVTKRSAAPLTIAEAMEWIDTLALRPCVPVDAPPVKRGISIAERYQIDYWDGAIIAAAERLGAEMLYTEDLNHGQVYGSVRAINPFL